MDPLKVNFQPNLTHSSKKGHAAILRLQRETLSCGESNQLSTYTYTTVTHIKNIMQLKFILDHFLDF